MNNDEIKLRLISQNELLHIKVPIFITNQLCNDNCLHDYMSKSISFAETECLRTCVSKIKEVEKFISKTVKVLGASNH